MRDGAIRIGAPLNLIAIHTRDVYTALAAAVVDAAAVITDTGAYFAESACTACLEAEVVYRITGKTTFVLPTTTTDLPAQILCEGPYAPYNITCPNEPGDSLANLPACDVYVSLNYAVMATHSAEFMALDSTQCAEVACLECEGSQSFAPGWNGDESCREVAVNVCNACCTE
jgi:hypothetical protein